MQCSVALLHFVYRDSMENHQLSTENQHFILTGLAECIEIVGLVLRVRLERTAGGNHTRVADLGLVVVQAQTLCR